MKAKPVNDIVIIDEPELCPYLPNRMARMPLKMPLRRIGLAETDLRLEMGHRRTGEFVYETNCPRCQECQPLRVDIDAFQFSRNQRRVLKRGDDRFQQRIGHIEGDKQRVDLFNRHRRLRNLAKRDTDIDLEEYVWGFVKSCFQSFEITYWLDGRLAGVAICDRGQKSLSAVYTFYDPDLKKDSLGTYSILKQIEYCQSQSINYLYLGYYIEDCIHMSYKSRFTPLERRINGQWIRFEKGD